VRVAHADKGLVNNQICSFLVHKSYVFVCLLLKNQLRRDGASRSCWLAYRALLRCWRGRCNLLFRQMSCNRYKHRSLVGQV
jgi:hypothetical protein